ncbi:hypothetical protein Ciccas_011384 [Cichlidogyrus casuarinus]|uniref:Uncharacterized protein n=1 Tax=Cichlidogyrus casuarinus TaxID=1844966 RepID=A0ABD2PRD8_9PLAT
MSNLQPPQSSFSYSTQVPTAQISDYTNGVHGQQQLPPFQPPYSQPNSLSQPTVPQFQAQVPTSHNQAPLPPTQFPTHPIENQNAGQTQSVQITNGHMPVPSTVSVPTPPRPSYNMPPKPTTTFLGQQPQRTMHKDPRQRITVEEWGQIRTPISLLHDKNLWPSDGLEPLAKPMLDTPVNCDPSIVQCTLTSFPSSQKLLKKCRLPLGIVMHPFKDLSTLCVIQSKSIVRCRSCRTYINPFVQFIDSGRRWRCPVCLLVNTVPDDFFYDPVTGHYGDPMRRPEIRSSTVEYIAPSEYTLRPPQAATYVFCIAVNRPAVTSGVLKIVCKKLSQHIHELPGDARRQMAIITFNSQIHFYKLLPDQSAQMLICPDVEEVFIPDMDGLMNRIESCQESLEEVLHDMIPSEFEDTEDCGNCLGSALQACFKLISSYGGRVTVFNCSLPNVGSGSLHNREEVSDRLTPDTKHINPAIDFYKTFALECAAHQVAVDQFVFNSQYSDLATLAGASRHSGGQIYHYPDFHYVPGLHTSRRIRREGGAICDQTKPGSMDKNNDPGWIEAQRFSQDFDRYLTRKLGLEAVLRVRCSTGVSLEAFHGCFFVRSMDLLALPNVNPDSGFAFQLGITEDIGNPLVVLQTAILYTSSRGDRRIRVHTLGLPVVQTESDVFFGADQAAIACLLAKMAVDRSLSSGLAAAREALVNAVADAISAYNASSSGAKEALKNLYCPATLRLLPLYVCGLLRSVAFRNHRATRLDERLAAMEYIKSQPPATLLPFMYPKLYPVHLLDCPEPEPTLSERVNQMKMSEAQQPIKENGEDHSRGDSSDSDSSSDDEQEEESDKETVDLVTLGPSRLSTESINTSGVYLLDVGQYFLLVVGNGANESPGLFQRMLGIDSVHELPACGGPEGLPVIPTKYRLPNGKRPLVARRLRRFLDRITEDRAIGLQLIWMRHDAPAYLRTRFLASMVEDRSETAPNYHEFLQMVQKALS